MKKRYKKERKKDSKKERFKDQIECKKERKKERQKERKKERNRDSNFPGFLNQRKFLFAIPRLGPKLYCLKRKKTKLQKILRIT